MEPEILPLCLGGQGSDLFGPFSTRILQLNEDDMPYLPYSKRLNSLTSPSQYVNLVSFVYQTPSNAEPVNGFQ